MAPGHMIPLVDMARTFARLNVKATIVMTPLNAALFTETIEKDRMFGLEINIRQLRFPSEGAGLPPGCENLASTTTPEMSAKFYKVMYLLQQPLEQLLQEDQPDCLVSDSLFPWTTEIARKLGIPRLIFHGIGVFPLCVYHSLAEHEPFKNIKSDKETFIVPDLPDTIKLTKEQLHDLLREESNNYFTDVIAKTKKSEMESYGVVVNSFHELEPAYSGHYKKVMRQKTWHIGPVSLCNRDREDKARRGKNASIGEHDCIDWLNSRKPNSVIYVCFGSLSLFSAAQLLEIATGLENSEQQFIWVVRKEKKEEELEKWLPEGFEKRMEERGLTIRGGAPQVLILDHEAVGGFVTHCGWNSLLEGVTAGVPMITWPLFAEQFYNEKLITDILKIGVAVGAQKWTSRTDEYEVSVERREIEKAVRQLMVSEEADEMRSRARALGNAAKKAVEEGGSSCGNLDSLLEELRLNRLRRGITIK